MENYAFEHPNDIYRGLDLWMVNDKLTHEEIEKQVREFKEKGLYSVIFRTYNGLTSDYPGEEFKSKLYTAIKTAKECGLKIALQAGFMPGAMPDIPEEYSIHLIIPVKKENLKGDENILSEYNGICYTERPEKGCLNMLDAESAEYYLKTAYEDMWKEFSHEYGKTIISVWVDEPRFNKKYLTWTPSLDDDFKKHYGYGLVENIPLLYNDIGDYKKVRYDYYTLLRDIMEKNYYSGVRDWCHKNGLSFSGHLMAEERLQMQIAESVAVMPFYKYFDIPGIDNLRCNHDWYDKSLKGQSKWHELAADKARFMGAVQCVSAAEQAGKEHILCEMYGVTSHSFVFRDMMHLFDFFASHGINHQCMHALFYSPRGFRKRFYPQTFNHYQPFWDNFKNIKDYVARVSSFVSMGKCTKDVLVLQPLETAYGLFCGLNDPNDESYGGNVIEYDNRYYKFITDLYASSINFHLGDISSINELGYVDANSLNIGQMSYKTVVLAEIEVITSKMMSLLKSFSEHGGKILVQGQVPSRIDGRFVPNLGKEILALQGVEYFPSKELLLRSLGKIPKSYNIECDDDDSETYINHRKDGEKHYFMVANGCCRKAKNYTLTLDGLHRAFRFDAEHNKVKEIYADYIEGKSVISFKTAIGSSALVFTEPYNGERMPENPSCYSVYPFKIKECRALSENVMTLEICTYKTEKMTEFTKKDIAIERANEILKREKYVGDVTVRFRFFSDFEAKNLKLVMEDIADFKATLNGESFELKDTGKYYSEAFRTVNLPDNIKCGENILELTVHYTPSLRAAEADIITRLSELFKSPVGMCLERVHIVGDFDVDTTKEHPTGAGLVRYGKYFFMTEKKKLLPYTDVTSHGYPFYPGKLLYKGNVNVTEEMLNASDILIKIGVFSGCSAKIMVNGVKAGFADREPYELSVKEYIKEGENLIEVELCGTFRNMFGPSHYEGADVSGCNRDIWYDAMAHVHCTEYDSGTLTNSFQLIPYGLGDFSVKTVK